MDTATNQPSARSPLRRTVFRGLWIASFISNIGTLVLPRGPLRPRPMSWAQGGQCPARRAPPGGDTGAGPLRPAIPGAPGRLRQGRGLCRRGVGLIDRSVGRSPCARRSDRPTYLQTALSARRNSVRLLPSTRERVQVRVPNDGVADTSTASADGTDPLSAENTQNAEAAVNGMAGSGRPGPAGWDDPGNRAAGIGTVASPAHGTVPTEEVERISVPHPTRSRAEGESRSAAKRWGSIRADTTARGSEATLAGASVSSDRRAQHDGPGEEFRGRGAG
jgi:hypothetical protein